MTLINKPTEDDYNTVVVNINQKIEDLIKEVEDVVNNSEEASSKLNETVRALYNRASNLKEYVLGLKNINKQIDAAMPPTCDYHSTYIGEED